MDNVATLGIEQCLLSGLADMFSPNVVMTVPEPMLQEIAAEPEDAQAERKRLTHKLGVLETGLKTLNRLNRQRSAGQRFHSVMIWGNADETPVYLQEHPPPPPPPILQSPSLSNIERAIPKRHENEKKSDRRPTAMREDGPDSPTPKPRNPVQRGVWKPSGEQASEPTQTPESTNVEEVFSGRLAPWGQANSPHEEEATVMEAVVESPPPKWEFGNPDGVSNISEYLANKKKAKGRKSVSGTAVEVG